MYITVTAPYCRWSNELPCATRVVTNPFEIKPIEGDMKMLLHCYYNDSVRTTKLHPKGIMIHIGVFVTLTYIPAKMRVPKVGKVGVFEPKVVVK